MSDSQQQSQQSSGQNPQVDLTPLLRQLRRIAAALENPRSAPVSKEPTLAAARPLVDYLALRHLMGRAPRVAEEIGFFPAAIDRTTTPPELVVGALPAGAKTVAVFTDRDTVADDVPLTNQPAFDPKTRIQGTKGYPLPNVGKDQVVTRVEFRRADGYPLALGPRLPAV